MKIPITVANENDWEFVPNRASDGVIQIAVF